MEFAGRNVFFPSFTEIYLSHMILNEFQNNQIIIDEEVKGNNGIKGLCPKVYSPLLMNQYTRYDLNRTIRALDSMNNNNLL